MADKMWAGRFSKEVDETVNAFNSSISFDGRMYRHDIQGSMAHAEMLGECGIISKEDSRSIISGLEGILSDIDSGKLEMDMTAEDIHMFIEAELTKRLGDVGKRLHYDSCGKADRNPLQYGFKAYRNNYARLHTFAESTAGNFGSSSYGLCANACERFGTS